MRAPSAALATLALIAGACDTAESQDGHPRIERQHEVSQMGLPALVIGAQPVAAGSGAAQWAEAVTKTVAFMKRCAETGRRFPLTEGSGLTHLWATVVHEDLGYHIVWFDHAGELDDQKAELRAVLAGFSFE